MARLETVRIILALAATEGWKVHHLDVKSTFINGVLHEEVYVTQPDGFVIKGKEHMVYRLKKALYGLRQAPRAWNERLDKVLKDMGFSRCPQEYGVYKIQRASTNLLVGVYVDELIVTGSSNGLIDTFKKQMKNVFDMSDLGLLTYYLGIKVTQKEGCITVSQVGYAEKVLQMAGMGGCNPTKYPMEPRSSFRKDGEGEPVNATDYRRLIGSLR